MRANNNAKSQPKTSSARFLRPFIITLSVLLVMAISGTVWLSNNVYDTKYFSKTLTTALTQESSRSAIADEITGQLYDGRPVAQRLLTQPTESLISALLNNERFQTLLTKMASNVNRRITQGNTQAIKIDISGFSEAITTVQKVVAPDSDFKPPSGAAASVTIIKANTLPNIKKLGQAVLFLNPFLILSLIAVAVVSLIKSREKLVWLRDAGLVMIVAGAILLTFTISASAYLSTFAQDQNQQIILQNIYSAFTQRFQTFQTWLIVIGGLSMLTSYTVRKYNWPAHLWGQAKSTFSKK